MADFQDELQEGIQDVPQVEEVSNEAIVQEINASSEKDYYKQLKKKHKGFLLDNITVLEKERIAQWIIDRYEEASEKHKETCERIDEYDDVYRMVRKSVEGDDDGDMPNYATPLSTVAIETIHANEMNVFFTPSDAMRVLPTEQNDIPKVEKLSTFGNWSMKNEMNLFERCDRLFHYSAKVGEAPYIVDWVKEYGTEIKRDIIMNPAQPDEPLYDPDTKEPLYQEIEEQKLLYNGPKLTVFSRKDYIQPPNALMDVKPDWEIRLIRKTYDSYLRDMMSGKLYNDSIQDITDWSNETYGENIVEDFEGHHIPVGKWSKEFIEFYGCMRILTVKKGEDDQSDEYEELEEEFIAIVHKPTGTLSQLRKNKFPLKLRPIGIDYFLPDDEGRRRAIGVCEFLEGPQKAYDALFNQYILGTVRTNSPIGFFTPMANQRNEPMKFKNGYLYPTADPNAINWMKVPGPDASIQLVMEIVSYWAQMLFGISDYAAGMESKIDPSAPAKKAEIVIQQGNVRLNLIIKRKNKTLKDIFKRWYLLYQANMPPNKFMRVAGDTKDDPWQFNPITLEDFALKSIPDFELVGNVLNSNKQLAAQKALGIYQLLSQNPFFAPVSKQGIQALHALTKWIIEKMDESGLAGFLPPMPGEQVHTPEEENARFLQGDYGKPANGEDHVNHLKVHNKMMTDPNTPQEIKEKLIQPHIQATIKLMKAEMTQQILMQQAQQQQQQMQPQQQQGGQPNVNQTGAGQPSQAATGQILS